MLVPLIALSYDHQNHSKWPKRGHVHYNLPFLVIDDNTIKASIKFAKIDKFSHLHLLGCLPSSNDGLASPENHDPPFVPPPISLLLPHDLIHLACLLLGNILFLLGNISPPLLRTCLALMHISPPLESNHLKGLVPKRSCKTI